MIFFQHYLHMVKNNQCVIGHVEKKYKN